MAVDFTSGLRPRHAAPEEPNTGRDVLHTAIHAARIQGLATAEHPAVKSSLTGAIKSIHGANIHGARDKKPAGRLLEKIDAERQPPRTIPDYSAFRVAVDSPEAKDKAVKAIRGNFEVIRDKDEFDKGAPDTGFHAHMMQVKRPGSAVSHEVQVLPREQADAAEVNHGLYDKARDGDKDAGESIKAKNKEAKKKFDARNGDKEHKFKFGNTQANIPPDSDAHKAIKDAQRRIPDAHLAGKDVDEPHVTVRYGIQGDKLDGIKKFITAQKPFDAKLGKTTSFPPSEHSDGAAPIVAPVHSPELHRLNSEIEKHGDFAPSSFPNYKPHATVAYVKPEVANKHVGNPATEGKTFRVSSISISDRDGNKEDVPMLGDGFAPKSEKGGGRGESPEQASGGAPKQPSPDASKAHLKTGVTVKLPDGRTGVVKGISPKGDVVVKLAGGGRARSTRADVQVVDTSTPAKGVTVGTPGHDRPTAGAIAVDLDKTMAEYTTFKGAEVIGKPIAAQIDQVKKMLEDGKDVWIYSARVEHPEAIPAIKAFSKENIGKELPMTNIKYPEFAKFIDDRAELPVQMQREKISA